MKTFILVLVVLLLVVIFSLQNPFPVYISLWFWQLEANLPLLMLIAILFGALISYLLSLSPSSRKNRELHERGVRIHELEKELNELKAGRDRNEIREMEITTPGTETGKKVRPKTQ